MPFSSFLIAVIAALPPKKRGTASGRSIKYFLSIVFPSGLSENI
jgi:hypothetical protein